MNSTGTWQAPQLASTFVGHDAREGFCPVCGAVAPCYRARRAQAPAPSA